MDRYYFLILLLPVGFILGTAIDTSLYNPLESNNVDCSKEQSSLEDVGWGVQQEKEATALHEGFMKGITTTEEKEYFKFLNEDNVPEDFHREEHHYKKLGFSVGNFLYHVNSGFWFIRTFPLS